MVDAVVVGSGPNGLAATVTLAGAGLSVQVIEGADHLGGRSATRELTRPGAFHDVCSAVHPMAFIGERNWLATIGGLVGLFIAAATFRGNLRARQIEQARLVYARIDRIEYCEAGQSFRITPGIDANHPQVEAGVFQGMKMIDDEAHITVSERSLMVIITVHNGSKERVGPIRLDYHNDAMRANMKLHNGINLIGPETEYPLAAIMANPLDRGQPSVSALIRFQDSSGRWWKRFRDEPK